MPNSIRLVLVSTVLFVILLLRIDRGSGEETMIAARASHRQWNFHCAPQQACMMYATWNVHLIFGTLSISWRVSYTSRTKVFLSTPELAFYLTCAFHFYALSMYEALPFFLMLSWQAVTRKKEPAFQSQKLKISNSQYTHQQRSGFLKAALQYLLCASSSAQTWGIDHLMSVGSDILLLSQLLSAWTWTFSVTRDHALWLAPLHK